MKNIYVQNFSLKPEGKRQFRRPVHIGTYETVLKY